MIPIFLAAAVLMAAAPDAKPGAPTSPPVKAATRPDPTTKVCWNEPRPGSHMSQRICGTQADLDRRTQEAHESVNDIRNRGTDQRVGPH